VVEYLLIGVLLYGVFPVWVIAGFADYLCHRVTRIEHTSGLTESWLHVAQYLQIAIGVALALLLEATSLVLVAVIVLAVLHLATGYLDVAFTASRRKISPPEQHVHSYMEVLPLVATALLVVLHWRAFAAIFDAEAASWLLALRQPPLPSGPVIAVAVGFAGAGLAVAEECWRCARRRSGNSALGD
jgi:hypothetical protein